MQSIIKFVLWLFTGLLTVLGFLLGLPAVIISFVAGIGTSFISAYNIINSFSSELVSIINRVNNALSQFSGWLTNETTAGSYWNIVIYCSSFDQFCSWLLSFVGVAFSILFVTGLSLLFSFIGLFIGPAVYRGVRMIVRAISVIVTRQI